MHKIQPSFKVTNSMKREAYVSTGLNEVYEQ